MQCDRLRAPSRGLISPAIPVGQKYNTGTTVSFDCEKGFSLVGAASLTCLRTGLWSAPVPTCAGKFATRRKCVSCSFYLFEDGCLNGRPQLHVKHPALYSRQESEFDCRIGGDDHQQYWKSLKADPRPKAHRNTRRTSCSLPSLISPVFVLFRVWFFSSDCG